MTPIEQLSSEEFSRAVRINVVYGPRCEVEQFAVARIGRIWYATSVQFGYAYTRPQLIEKYRNVRATYTILPVINRRHCPDFRGGNSPRMPAHCGRKLRAEKMAYGCTYCGGKLLVENLANDRRILTYRCGCGRSYFGPFLPASAQQAGAWLGRRPEIKLGRLVKLARKEGTIVAVDNKRHVLASY